jgi:hypothetical protein
MNWDDSTGTRGDQPKSIGQSNIQPPDPAAHRIFLPDRRFDLAVGILLTVLRAGTIDFWTTLPTDISYRAFAFADAMLAENEKGKQ